MDLKNMLKEMKTFLASDEGKKSMTELATRMDAEEELAAELESKSTLVYKDGQKVMRGDVFIDDYHENLKEQPYGATSYVARINEDGTIDNCFASCTALRANGYKFTPEASRLVRRNGKLQSPLDGPVTIE